MEAFEAFVESDFLAFTQEKWASNAFNRQRQAVKEKLRRLGHAALAPLGLPLTFGTSPEYPSQWNGRKVSEQWFFALLGTPEELRHAEWVADQERSLELLVADPLPEHKHLGLALCIDEHHLRVSLVLWPHAAADQKNLRAQLSTPEGREAFLAHAAGLSGFAWVDAAGQHLTAQQLTEAVAPFEVRQTVARHEALDEQLPSVVSALFAALLPLYRSIAWSSSHDLANIGEQLREAARKREEAKKREEEERQQAEKQKEEEREREREAAKTRAAEADRVREHQRLLEDQRREQDREAARLAFEERRKQAIEREKEEAERRKALQEAIAKKREEQPKEPASKEPEARTAEASPAEKRPAEVRPVNARPAPERRPEQPRRHENGPRPEHQQRRPEPRADARRPEPRPEQPRRPEQAPRPEVEKQKPVEPKRERAPKPVLVPATPGTLKNGDRVQLLEGPFSGKVGFVQEIDHRREAKITLGMMSVKAPEITLAKF